MVTCRIRSLAIFGLVLLAVGVVLAGEKSESLSKKLAEFKGAERGEIIPITEETVARVFPRHQLYMLRFRQYPVAMASPQGLKANNLFAVKPDGSVEYIPDVDSLERFFKATLSPVRTETEAKDAVGAWLRLGQEFYQDGFFQFLIPEGSIRVTPTGDAGIEVSGKALVDKQGGNAGEIVAFLTFDRSGALKKVSETAQLHPGIRPICQTTRLLDPDPVVRGMAEQDILVMGKAAQGYLEEQRAKANPDLQSAIDRIWQRILNEKR